MEITLKPKHEKMIKLMMKNGEYDSSRAIVEAALDVFLVAKPSNEVEVARLKELRGMIAVGMEQSLRRQVVSGDSVLAKVRKMQREYRKKGR